MNLMMLSPPVEIEPEAAGPIDYVLTFPVPGPEAPGSHVFLTLTPDGRPTVVMVDTVEVDTTVRGYLGDYNVVTLPKEAPWMLLRRNLLRHQSKADARRTLTENMERMLGPGGACPVHGVAHGAADASVEAAGNENPTGQYI